MSAERPCKHCGTPYRDHHTRLYCSDLCRFTARYVREGDCWVWTGYLYNGYGFFRQDGKARRCHRVGYELYRGPVPEGLHLDHLCRNRACVNPWHLEPVTNAENSARGNSPGAILFRLNQCKSGHEMTPENSRYEASGRRRCRKCIAARAVKVAAARVARKAAS